MKRLVPVLTAAFLTILGGRTVGRAELMTPQPDSMFDVDGLMADQLESEKITTNEAFRAGIKPSPRRDVNKPIRTPSSFPSLSSVQTDGSDKKALQANLQAADVYAKQRNWSKALAEIQRGLELEPDNPLLIRKAAAFAAMARKFDVADEYFQKVLNVYPDSVYFLAGRAGILLRLGKLKEAEELAKKALAIDPAFLAARFNGLCVRIARGEKDISAEGWDLLTLNDLVELANWLNADKQDYLQALGPEGYQKLCDIVLGPGVETRLTEIVDLLRRAVSASQASQWSDFETALSQVKKAGVRAVSIDADIGKALYEKGDKDAALARFKALADQYPKADFVLYDYAYVLIHVGQYSQAAEILEQVRKLNPENGQAAFALACSYAALGKTDQAWPILTRLATTHANEMPIWLMGDKPYHKAIRNDPRYAELQKFIKAAQRNVP